MTLTPTEARPLDHFVLQVSGLDAARARLSALGFQVAANGYHPFGTANCCIFFADGTFLEPLAIADEAMARAAAGTGNVFTRHALSFREENGPEGFSAFVFGTNDAKADHAAFAEDSISAGEILDFARDFVAADGSRGRAAFRLAFALAAEAPNCLFFSCERVAVPEVDRTALYQHPNGVTAMAGAIMVAPDPAALRERLASLGWLAVDSEDGAVRFTGPSFALSIVTPRAFAALTGLPEPEDLGPAFRAAIFSCRDEQQLMQQLLLAGIDFNFTPDGVIVPPADGQGTTFIFRSQQAV
ncbi:VOC family protein [Mesorhizobium sp. Z1-4]|uniref:VOC family protein n=1 Tax=Mesorhizobium sp. Z1-4 TaxID=2448478 RepID=UPI000FDBB0EB|nr:VOC family protein [Mesorhizobium sp. Z1-4]